MKNKLFPAPFFNHFIQPSPLPIAKLKSYMVSWVVNFPHKIGPISLWFAPRMITSKSPPILYAFPSPIKRRAGFTWTPQSQRPSVQKVLYKFNPLSVVLTFQIIYQWPRSWSMRGKLTWHDLWNISVINFPPSMIWSLVTM